MKYFTIPELCRSATVWKYNINNQNFNKGLNYEFNLRGQKRPNRGNFDSRAFINIKQ